MIPAPFDYVTAATVDEAVGHLQRFGDDAKLIAGGQSLVPLMRLRLAQPSALVDISRMRGADAITREDGHLSVGAGVHHADIERSPAVRDALPLLAAVAHEVGDNQVRNLGTMGGVIAHGDAAGDYCALALMLDAEIVTSKRRHAASGFFKDVFTTALEPDEVVTAVRFPVATGAHAYQKFRRRLFDWAIAGVMVQRTEAGWRVGYVNLGPTAVRGAGVEQALAQGAAPAEAARRATQGLEPRDDVRATAAYKRHLATVLTQRALESAA
ncbi:MAG TPA: xanthine dehydrogenase family protein subunit M [Candidatus Dormibacteraeota bacterium]